MSHAFNQNPKHVTLIKGTSCDFTHLPTKTQLLVHHTSDIHIFQPRLPILFLTLDHAQANTLSVAITKKWEL